MKKLTNVARKYKKGLLTKRICNTKETRPEADLKINRKLKKNLSRLL